LREESAESAKAVSGVEGSAWGSAGRRILSSSLIGPSFWLKSTEAEDESDCV